MTVSSGLLDCAIEQVPFVMLDLETTGLEVDHGDRVCEVALLRIEGDREVARYEQLINPCRAIDPEAYRVNQIDSMLLEGAPVFGETLPTLMPLLEDAVIVAHNAFFDMAFLVSEFQRLGRPPLRNPVLDTLSLSRSLIRAQRYNLRALSASIGVAPPTHRAMSDVIALRALFGHLVELLRGKGATTLRDVLQAQWGSLPVPGTSHLPRQLSEALEQGRRVRIAYQRHDGTIVEREILPLGISSRGTLPVLHAFCYLRNSPRSFTVERIQLI